MTLPIWPFVDNGSQRKIPIVFTGWSLTSEMIRNAIISAMTMTAAVRIASKYLTLNMICGPPGLLFVLPVNSQHVEPQLFLTDC